MRAKFYCHSVTAADDGRLIIHMSAREGNEEGQLPDEILIKARFKSFGEDEVPRQWHHFEILIRGIGP